MYTCLGNLLGKEAIASNLPLSFRILYERAGALQSQKHSPDQARALDETTTKLSPYPNAPSSIPPYLPRNIGGNNAAIRRIISVRTQASSSLAFVIRS